MRQVLRYVLACFAVLALSLALIGDKATHPVADDAAHAAAGAAHPHGPDPHENDCHGLLGVGCQIVGVVSSFALVDVDPELVSETAGARRTKLNDLLNRAPPSPPPNPA